jgi:hypothetical protein
MEVVMLLVWVTGLKGPEVQKWPERPVLASGKSPETLREETLLPEEEHYPIHVLEALYRR